MTLWEFRQMIEDAIPLWIAIPIILILATLKVLFLDNKKRR
jgi:hypothetical protein